MHSREIIVVSDNFYPGYTGGAELTTYAITSQSPAWSKISFIPSRQLNYFHIALNKSKLWIFTNIEQASKAVIANAANVLKNYVVVEYDFKCCIYRSPDKHKYATGTTCNCNIPEINALLRNARHVFFMSEKQREFFVKNKGLSLNASVLSSCFTKTDIDALETIARKRDASASKWMILYSDSWVKGCGNSVRHAVKEGLDYQLIEETEHSELLEMFSRFKGLVYKPEGADTCPRIVIEARLAGCELILNDNVLHRDEAWFSANRQMIAEYLRERPDVFWSKIEEISNV